MTQLWALMALMALAGALVVVLPMLKHRQREELSGVAVNSLVYRDRLQELETDLREGRVQADEFAQLKAELELTLLDDVNHSQQDQSPRSLTGRWLVWPLFVLIPLLAFFLYWNEGYRTETRDWLAAQPRLESWIPLMLAGNLTELEQQGAELPDLIRGMQARLQKKPEDARSWYLLGVSYMQMRMAEQAELAFNRALHIEPQNIDYILGHTQAAMALNNGTLSADQRQILVDVIELQPDNPKPYMTLGMSAFMTGDFNGAITVWQQYVQRPSADPNAVQMLQRSIDVASKQLAQASAPAGEKAQPGADKPSLNVTVDVAADVRKQLSASDTLFVYAKAVNGPPMPLAVVKQPVGNWPVIAELSDANAMTPMATLSKFPEVIVQARISATGNAIPQSGDWIGPTQVVKLAGGKQDVSLQITGRMP
ncbi:MAG TPA: c-type cytochrome biogenesis protein CcmI [Dongiaceae bacterium]|nr:c-type cytochrome biogenesis protein CcmI [Dongiaceae bacterium]